MGLVTSLITGLARLFGVSLVELAADREGAGRQLAEAAATATDDETLLDVVFDHVDHDAVASAVDAPGAVLLAGTVLRREYPDDQQRRDILEELAIELELEPNEVFWKPVEQIEQLPDRPQDTYIWVLRDGVDPAGFADQIDSMYRERFNRGPRGLHVPVADVEEIRLADPTEIRTYVEPHLSRAAEHEQQGAELADPADASSAGGD